MAHLFVAAVPSSQPTGFPSGHVFSLAPAFCDAPLPLQGLRSMLRRHSRPCCRAEALRALCCCQRRPAIPSRKLPRWVPVPCTSRLHRGLWVVASDSPSSGPAASPPLQLSVKRASIAVFVSGGGSNFRAIHSAILQKKIYADVTVVVSDSPGCGGCQYASEHGIPVITFPSPKATPGAGVTLMELLHALQRVHGVDYIVLAGYIKLVPAALVRAYPRRMLNIHPALLPAFGGRGMYGPRVHAAVLASGARLSGATVHFVDEGYDTGPILAQAAVPVLPTDTTVELAARVLAQEHLLYPEAVAALVAGRVTWRGDGVPIVWSAH